MKHILYGHTTSGNGPRFELGRIVATPGAIELMLKTQTDPFALLARHVTGDWGDCCAEDAQTNEEAVAHGFRVFSVYALPLLLSDQRKAGADPAHRSEPSDSRIWLITEADRSCSTFLLPHEY